MKKVLQTTSLEISRSSDASCNSFGAWTILWQRPSPFIDRVLQIGSIHASIMPYQALQCFSCHVMQVKEVRKPLSSNSKWSCLLCSEKQSVGKVYCRADIAKEVPNFVQKFNLARGQDLEVEGRARLGFESPTEDLAADHNYQEDKEDELVKQRFGRSDCHSGQKKSFKWDKFLPVEEEQACSGDQIQQSSDDMKLTTTYPESSSRRRTRPCSSSSPPPKRPRRDWARRCTVCSLQPLMPLEAKQYDSL